MSLKRITVTEDDKTLALKGKYFKVISASGELKLRFFYDDDTELETELYQGLGIKHPRSFVNFTIAASQPQDVVIFASDAELIDDRSETSLVGAVTLNSANAALVANAVQEIVPAKLGRRSLLIQSEALLYVGGGNLDANNGVKVDAGESIELDTQAAVYGLSSTNQAVRILEEVG